MASLSTPYRLQIAERLRKLYIRQWVQGTGLTADEAEWLLRAVCELEDARTLSPAALHELGQDESPDGGTRPEDERMARVRELLSKGQKVEAIQLYRLIQGCSLLEARAACLGPRVAPQLS